MHAISTQNNIITEKRQQLIIILMVKASQPY